MEAMVALGLQALLLASVLVTSTGLALLAGEAWDLQATLFAQRQLEHLVDTAALRAGAGPSSPPAIASAAADKVVFYTDADGNGTVDLASSEKTEIEIRRPTSSTRALLHRLGNQGMTVDDRLPATSTLAYIEASGLIGAANDATAVRVPTRGAALVVAIPARLP